MRLVLELPADLTLSMSRELIQLPDDAEGWVQSALHADLPRGAHVRVLRTEEEKTQTGWPVRLVDSEIRAEDDRLLEIRVHAFYWFLEHAAAAVVRAPDATRRDEIVACLMRGAPDFSGPVVALAPLYDLEVPEPCAEPEPQQQPELAATPSLEQIFHAAKAARGDFAQLAAALLHVDQLIAGSPGPIEHFVRGGILAQLGQRLEAVDSYRTAIQIEPNLAEAHFALGLTYADLGRDADAIAAWEETVRVKPDHIDAWYNAAQACYTRGEHQRALELLQAAAKVSPDDFFILKKIAQCQHALARHDDAERTHDEIARVWSASPDARVRQTNEYVFDQFVVAGRTVHAFETLRPPRPDFISVFSFRVVDEHGQPTGLSAQLETSAIARAKGTPFVLTLLDRERYRVLGTFDDRPPYPQLKQLVTQALAEVIPPRSS